MSPTRALSFRKFNSAYNEIYIFLKEGTVMMFFAKMLIVVLCLFGVYTIGYIAKVAFEDYINNRIAQAVRETVENLKET